MPLFMRAEGNHAPAKHTDNMKTEIEKLVKYMLQNPALNMTIYCNDVLGDNALPVASFPTHAMALKAVQTVRAEIDALLVTNKA